MPRHFAHIAFTPAVKAVQEKLGSRKAYARLEQMPEPGSSELTQVEQSFIAARDSFYMATVSETGWPYIQHRGGPVGFVRALDPGTIGFADFSGNRQYVSVGNLMGNDRVSLFFMDYPNKTRLKLLGRVKLIGMDRGSILSRLEVPTYRARVERGFIIAVEAFDWNCPQHITERYTAEETGETINQLSARVAELEGKLARSLPIVDGA